MLYAIAMGQIIKREQRCREISCWLCSAILAHSYASSQYASVFREWL